MINPSGSILFPFGYDNENDCLLRAFTIEDTLLSAIRCFLVTRKGSRVGNNVGSFLPELLLQTIPSSSLSGFASELQNELSQQFPGVDFLNVTFQMNVTQQVSELIVTITFTVVNQDNITELILRLPSVFDASRMNSIQNTL